MSDRRVLVAGGAGFLGSHLCDRLVERGDHVICVDDLSTGRTDNILQLDGHDRFEFVQLDLVDGAIGEVVTDGVTDIMHLASPAAPPEYLRRPLDTLAVNSTGTQHLLDLAQRIAVALPRLQRVVVERTGNQRRACGSSGDR